MPVQLRNADLEELLTASFLRREGWRTWTPVLNQPGVIPANVEYARYAVLANTVHLMVRMNVTGAGGVAGNAFEMTGLPAAIGVANPSIYTVIGGGVYFDNGATYYHIDVVASTAVVLKFWADRVTNWLGVDPAVALAAGDNLSFHATYERA